MKKHNRLGLAFLLTLIIFPVTRLGYELEAIGEAAYGWSFWLFLLLGSALLIWGADSSS